MPCHEVAPTVVQQYRAYQDDGSSDKTFDSDSGGSGSDEMASDSINVVRACSKGKWLKTLRTVIDKMDGGGSRRRPRQVKTILRPPTTYVFEIGMSGLPSKVAIYPKWMWGDPSGSGRLTSRRLADNPSRFDEILQTTDAMMLSLFCRMIYIDLFLLWFWPDNMVVNWFCD